MKKKRRKLLWIVPAALILLLGAAALFINGKLSRIRYSPGSGSFSKTSQPVDNSEITLPNIPYSSGGGGISVPSGVPLSKDGVYNILMLGTDERSAGYSTDARADSIMLLSLNEKKKTVKLVSLERAIGVPIPGMQDDWLTHTFRYGGAALTLSTVQNCFKIKVDRYVRFDFTTFTKTVDSVGGVDINLSQKESDTLTYIINVMDAGTVPKHDFNPGINHLDGTEALAYSRLRSIDSDWQRIQRQRTVVQAVINKAKTLNLLQLNALANNTLSTLQTNLTKVEIAQLLLEAPGYTGKTAEQLTIPQQGTYWGKIGQDGRDLFAIDFAKNDAILQKFLYD